VKFIKVHFLSILHLPIIAFFLLLPTQLGKHFWPSFSYLSGVRFDYLSPTIFLNDFVIIVLIVSWLIFNRRSLKLNKKYQVKDKLKYYLIFFSVFVFIIINVFVSYRKEISIYYWLRIVEFYLLWRILKISAFSLEKLLGKYLSLSVILISVLAIFQFFHQKSMNGLWYFLGERSFSLSTPGIAKVVLNGSEVLRSYATFPHPNVMAGFLVCSMLIILSTDTTKILKLLLILTSTISVIFSFSQTNWFILIFISLFLFFKNIRYKNKKLFLFLILLSYYLIKLLFISVPLEKKSIEERVRQINISFNLIQARPFFGVGLGNYLPAAHEQQRSSANYKISETQPVHNVLLLIFTELGLLGLIIYLYILVLSLIKAGRSNLYYFLSILVVVSGGLFDHYWFTIYQTQALQVVLLALIWRQ
jgi:O-antigen ligase